MFRVPKSVAKTLPHVGECFSESTIRRLDFAQKDFAPVGEWLGFCLPDVAHGKFSEFQNRSLDFAPVSEWFSESEIRRPDFAHQIFPSPWVSVFRVQNP